MDDHVDSNGLNKILLKPRFKIKMEEDKAAILDKFKTEFTKGGSQFSGKIVDHHIIIDISKSEQHFWSPQLHVEVEENEGHTSIVKGLFGPKPTVWSLFMFVHFGVALAFVVFLVIAYTRWSLNKDYTTSVLLCVAMPIVWVVLYFFGRLGRKKGTEQMNELRTYFFKILEK